MALTVEEIQQGLAESPEIKTQLIDFLASDATEHLKGKGFVVRTQDEESKFLRKYEDEKIDPRVQELYDRMDADIFESSGIQRDKAKHKKSWEYAKDAIGTLKSQIADLQKGAPSDDATKQLILTLQAELKTAKEEKEGLSTQFSQKEMGWKIGNEFNSAFNDLKISTPTGVAEKDSESYQAKKRSMLQNSFLNDYTPEEKDGKIIFKDKQGEYAMSGGNYATAKELLTKDYSFEFEQGQQRKGTGSNGGQSRGTDLAAITDKSSIYAQAAKEGLTVGSAPWRTRVNEIATSKGISLE